MSTHAVLSIESDYERLGKFDVRTMSREVGQWARVEIFVKVEPEKLLFQTQLFTGKRDVYGFRSLLRIQSIRFIPSEGGETGHSLVS